MSNIKDLGKIKKSTESLSKRMPDLDAKLPGTLVLFLVIGSIMQGLIVQYVSSMQLQFKRRIVVQLAGWTGLGFGTLASPSSTLAPVVAVLSHPRRYDFDSHHCLVIFWFFWFPVLVLCPCPCLACLMLFLLW